MKAGRIKKLFIDRGYGFICPEGGGMDVYFRVKEYAGDIPFPKLRIEDKVLYCDEINTHQGRVRLRATFVRRPENYDCTGNYDKDSANC